MLDSEDLHGRVGQFEQAISAFDSKQKVLLERLQDGLALARERLVERKHEVERLKRENLELRQIIDRLLESIEGRSKDAMGDQLGALDRELDSLMALAEEETPSAAVATARSAPASPVERAPASPDSAPAFAKASSAPSDDDELASAFSDIERRIQELARHFPTGASAEEAGDTAPPDAPEVPPSAPVESAPVESAPVETVEPEAAVASSTLSADPPEPEAAAAPAPMAEPEAAAAPPPAPAEPPKPEAPVTPPPPPEPETAAAPPPAPKAKPVRTAASPEYRSSPRPQSRPQPAKAYAKTRGPLDAEVGYALSVLRQMRRSDKLFSIDDVRELINGKFGLDLTANQDSQIRACLSRRDGVYPNPKNDSFWRFGDAA